MTLSNKILVGFFGIILIYMLMAFAEIRIKGDTRILNNENSSTESIPLDNVKYISIGSEIEEELTITSSQNPQINIRSKSGQLLANMKYEIKGDTLFLLNFDEAEEKYSLTIEVPIKGFIGFTSAAARVYLSNMQQLSLSIIQTGGRVVIEEKVILARLNITASNNAYTEVSKSTVDTLHVTLDHSDFRSYGKINRIEGFIANESDFYSTNIYDVQLKRDKSSQMRMY